MSHVQEMAAPHLALTLVHMRQCEQIIVLLTCNTVVLSMKPCRQRRWSDPNSWPSGELPREGENVTISSRWRMLVDISPPPLSVVIVLGELTFEDERDYNFTANLVNSVSHRDMYTRRLKLDLDRFWSTVQWLVWSLEQRAVPSPTALSSHWLEEERTLHWCWPILQLLDPKLLGCLEMWGKL